MNPHRQVFLDFCAEITGHPTLTLEGTGLVDDYQTLLELVIGQPLAFNLYATAREVLASDDPTERTKRIENLIAGSPLYWPITANLISLWYLGTWTPLPDEWYATVGRAAPVAGSIGYNHVPSARSYVEQLSYRTAGAHTPGAKPTGYGSWALPPVF